MVDFSQKMEEITHFCNIFPKSATFFATFWKKWKIFWNIFSHISEKWKKMKHLFQKMKHFILDAFHALNEIFLTMTCISCTNHLWIEWTPIASGSCIWLFYCTTNHFKVELKWWLVKMNVKWPNTGNKWPYVYFHLECF